MTRWKLKRERGRTSQLMGVNSSHWRLNLVECKRIPSGAYTALSALGEQRHICIFSGRLELPLFRFVCYFIHCCFDGGGGVKLHTASKNPSRSEKNWILCKNDLGKVTEIVKVVDGAAVLQFGFEPTKLFNAHVIECCRTFC